MRTGRTFKGLDGRAWGFLAKNDTVLVNLFQRYSMFSLKKKVGPILSLQATGSLTNRSTPAAASVLAFLERTYWSIGETLPHEILGE